MWQAFLVLALIAASIACAQPVIWVASPWEHVLKSSEPGASRDVTLEAAANEYEAFRIIVRAGETPLPEVTLAASDLEGPAGTIPGSNITLFREYYLNVFAPSPRSTAPTGWYPDALIAFVDPETGQDIAGAQYDASPYTIEAGANQGYWADLFVPRATAAGEYRGSVTVTAQGAPVAVIPVSLTVWPFELPDTFAMKSNFGTLGSRIAKKNNLDINSPEFAEIEDLYIDAFLAHRAIPSGLGNIWPQVREDGTVDDSQTGERLRMLVEDKHVNALRLAFSWGEGPEKTKHRMGALARYLREKGWLDLAYVYMRDEPNDAEEYETVRQQGAALKEADPGIRRMCTEQTITSNPEWGDLYGAVDIWCPLWGLWDEKTARERQELGEALWSYTALCQREAPFWQVDFAPVHFRAPFWVSWRYGIEGFLYWSSVYWDAYEDVWNKPHFRDRYWGEGMLVYPGLEAGIRGPVPSIRLKLVREALEDFEIMTLAAERGKKAEVDAIVNAQVRSFQDWNQDPQGYADARRELAGLLQ